MCSLNPPPSGITPVQVSCARGRLAAQVRGGKRWSSDSFVGASPVLRFAKADAQYMSRGDHDQW